MDQAAEFGDAARLHVGKAELCEGGTWNTSDGEAADRCAACERKFSTRCACSDAADLCGRESRVDIQRQRCDVLVVGRVGGFDEHRDFGAAVDRDFELRIGSEDSIRRSIGFGCELGDCVAVVKADGLQRVECTEEGETLCGSRIISNDPHEVVGRDVFVRPVVEDRFDRREPCAPRRRECRVECVDLLLQRVVVVARDDELLDVVADCDGQREVARKIEALRCGIDLHDSLFHIRPERFREREAEVECVANIHAIEERNLDVEKVGVAELICPIAGCNNEVEKLLRPHAADVEDAIEVGRRNVDL